MKQYRKDSSEVQIRHGFRRFPAKWIFEDPPPPPFILFIAKHFVEIMAFGAQNRNGANWLPPVSYVKSVRKKGRYPNRVLLSLISCNMDLCRPSSPFNLYVGKHVAEIKASASQNSNGAPWLQPDSYEKWYRRDRPRSKSGLVSVYFRQSVIYLCKRSILHLYRSLESRYLKPKNEKLPLCLPDFYVRGYKNTLPPDS